MSLFRKVLLSLLTIILYLIPLFRLLESGTPQPLENLAVVVPDSQGNPGNEPPYFAEYFVNEARPGMMCHVSSIAPAGDKKLICTWYAGSREAATDVAIYAAFFDLDRETWSPPQVLLTPQKSTQELGRLVRKLGNALVFNDGRGRLWLFYAAMTYGGWSATSLHYKVSNDGGQTWSPSRKLFLSPFFNLTTNLKNQGVILTEGAFLLPLYQEFFQKFSQLLFAVPKPGGLSYELWRLTCEGSAIQPALVPWGPRHLIAFFRNATSPPTKYILRAETHDLGLTWSPLTPTPLPHPGSGFAMLARGDGSLLGVINHSFRDRSNLTLILSRDAGRTWQALKILEEAPGREYSYPFLVRYQQRFHLTYTYERQRVKHVIFNDAWLERHTENGDQR